MDLSTKTRTELLALCKERKFHGYYKESKTQLLARLQGSPPTYKVVSLFSGMCGMDIGFAEDTVVHQNSLVEDYADRSAFPEGFVHLKRLPFEVVFQNDILPEAKAIAELNHWDHNYQLRDIRDLLAENYTFPYADIVTGGFPCQDFSHAGKRRGFDSERGTLYQSYVEVVRRIRPLLFVAENVNGLLTMKDNPIQQIVREFADVGYEVAYQLLKCEEFGIPQTRWRVLIFGIRSDKRKYLPDNWNIISENRHTCPIRCYFEHLQEPSDSEDPAQQVYSKAARLAKGQGQKEIQLDQCAPTMRAEHHGNIEFRRIANGVNNEPDRPERRLTVREAALIQTFPPTCQLVDPVKKTSRAYKPIGNAVPPLLGYLIARKVQQILDQLPRLNEERPSAAQSDPPRH